MSGRENTPWASADGPSTATAAREPGGPRRGLLTLNDAAAYLAIAPKTLRNWASQRRLHVVKLGGVKGPLRFRVADLDAFILKCVRAPLRNSVDDAVTEGLRSSGWRA